MELILGISYRIWISPKPWPSPARTKMNMTWFYSEYALRVSSPNMTPWQTLEPENNLDLWRDGSTLHQSSVYKTNGRLFAKVETFWDYSSLTLPNCSSLIFHSLGPLSPSPGSVNGCSGPGFPRQDEPVSNTQSWLLTAICCTQASLEVTEFSDWFWWASGHTFCNRLCCSPLWGWVPAVTNTLMDTCNHMYEGVPGLLSH